MEHEKEDNIPTNLRLLLVIEEIAKAGVPVTPTEVNQTLGLPRATIHRLFATLEEQGFLRRDINGRAYSPARRLRILSSGILSSLHTRTARRTIIRRVADTIGETVNISLPLDNSMVYIDRVETEWSLRIQFQIGTRVPFYCTASGKMYLSSMNPNHLERYVNSANLKPRTFNTITEPAKLLEEIATVRKQGYALDREEFLRDMIAIAVPIKDPHGRLQATLSFHAPILRFDIERAVSYLDVLRQGADELSRIIVEEDELEMRS